MVNIIAKKNWYYLISLVLIIPGIVSLVLFGLNLSIDFTGGSRVSLLFPEIVNESTLQKVKAAFDKEKIEIATIQKSQKVVFVRTEPISEKENTNLQESFKKSLGEYKLESFETIGPTVGREITLNAFYSILVASGLIVLYIAWSFRKVPKPTSSWRFGICAVAAVIHDAFLLLGVFSLLGHFFHVEIDSLFVTAVLTVIGFSVHDTIVVFDRIKENLQKTASLPFATVVNNSILETLARSLNTSITAMLVLFTLLLFGGESIRWFVVALLIGIASGTYSSIFNAAPLLVSWNEFDEKRRKKLGK